MYSENVPIHGEVLGMLAWGGRLELTGLETLQVSLSPVCFLLCFFMPWLQL